MSTIPSLKTLCAAATPLSPNTEHPTKAYFAVAAARAELNARLSPEVVLETYRLADEISEGAGAFNRDPLKHAENVIAKSVELANQIKALLDGQPEARKP